jgi:3-hydroxy-9,10-secoandrosta-1,3,5(10)-triene-9,17-dione monooxygenase reductase component
MSKAAGAPPRVAPVAIDPDRYRQVMGRFVSGVTVVTTLDHVAGTAQPFGTTVNSFSSVSLEPPLILITVGRERSIHPVIARTGRFAVNILAEESQGLSDCFAGAPSSIPRTAFCGADWRPSAAGQPFLTDALAWIDCELERTIDAGDHTIHLGRVVELEASDRQDWPLLYYRRRYLKIEHAEAVDLRGKPDET